MKTERNGFLETAWKKFKEFLNTYPGSLHCEFIFLLIFFIGSFACAYVAGDSFFDLLDLLPSDFHSLVSMCSSFSVYFGFLCSFLISSLFNLLFLLPFTRKSSGSAPDENIKNTKMEGKCKNEKND